MSGSGVGRAEKAWDGDGIVGELREELLDRLETRADMARREISFGRTAHALMLYIPGMVQESKLEAIRTEMAAFPAPEHPEDGEAAAERLKLRLQASGAERWTGGLEELLKEVQEGSTALLAEGLPDALLVDTRHIEARSLEEPISEAVLRGPRIGFCESLEKNAALLRSYGSVPDLAMERLEVGSAVRKPLLIVYMRDVVQAGLIEEMKLRIRGLEGDDFPESGYIEQMIEDNSYSPFQQLQNTERPDRVMSGLLEGRAAILLEGTPFALIAPFTLPMIIQSPEDYYERWLPGSLIRMLRFFSALIAMFTPALYIAFTSFHPGLIPTKLALTVVGARQGVPFPSLIEALIMEVSLEILREAGLRLPKPIGPAMGIVGGLIIGEAAVQAGIISPILVIVVAITAISSFVIPVYSAGISIRMLRFGAMFSAAVYGLYGVVLFFLLLLSHLSRLKSFGTPFLRPLGSYRAHDFKDMLVRFPLPAMLERRRFLAADRRDPAKPSE